MFKCVWNGTFSVGLAIGFFFSFSFFFYFYFFAYIFQAGDSYNANNQNDQTNPKDVDRLIAAIEGFNPWHDTIAQWGMSLMAVIATFASIYAVFLLRGTLDATRQTLAASQNSVQATQKVGAQQVRAFLYIHKVIANIVVKEYGGGHPNRYFLVINLMMDNGGQSPATKVRRDITLKKDPPEKVGLIDLFALESRMNRDIPAGSPSSFYNTKMEITENDFYRFCRKEYIFVLSGSATYDILFGGETGRTPFEFHFIFDELDRGYIQVKNRTRLEYS